MKYKDLLGYKVLKNYYNGAYQRQYNYLSDPLIEKKAADTNTTNVQTTRRADRLENNIIEAIEGEKVREMANLINSINQLLGELNSDEKDFLMFHFVFHESDKELSKIFNLNKEELYGTFKSIADKFENLL